MEGSNQADRVGTRHAVSVKSEYSEYSDYSEYSENSEYSDTIH